MGSHRVGHDWSDLAAAATHFKCGRKKIAESDIIRKYLVFSLVHGISETCNVIQIFFRVRIFVFSVLCLVAQSCPTLWDPMNYSLPGSYVHGILQARILEWISLSSSRSSQPKDWTQVSFFTGDFLYHLRHPRRLRIPEWVAYPFCRGIFLTQGSNLHWQAASLPLAPPEKPITYMWSLKKYNKLVNKTKKERTHRYRGQTSGYQ